MINKRMEELHFSRLDKSIADFLMQRSSYSNQENNAKRLIFKGIVSRLSASLSKGHSCIKLSSEQQMVMKSSGLVSTKDNTPLILEGSRLYLHRYWHYETRLANQLKYKVENPPQVTEHVSELLEKYFPETSNGDIESSGAVHVDQVDWQKLAAKNVAQQSFSIITGGPGTGKTTTVLKILALLQELHGLHQDQKTGQHALMIALAAPTGKAAMRLQESMGEGKQKLRGSGLIDEKIEQSIPDQVTTIHRLLGAKPASPYFCHHAENPLAHDLVVIDEASMVDLALMSKLVDALNPAARLILLGDKDQLASVESGSVLSDLSQGLPENTSELKRSFRFDSQIKDFAIAINQQNRRVAWDILQANEYPSISLVHDDALFSRIMAALVAYFSAVSKKKSVEEVFDCYKQFQILCSNRRGKRGVEGVNFRIEQRLHHQGVQTSQSWYQGKPIIITQNDPATQLFNGDIGICLQEKGHYYFFFQLANGDIKKLLPTRLPQHETAYALTIHKSQGSEFDHVLMVLPDRPNSVLGKELIYTAVTRAKKKVEVASSQQVFEYALSQQVQRDSGLKVKIKTE